MAWLSTSGVIVIVCVLAGLYFMARRPRRQDPVAFGAERLAEDVLDDSMEAPLVSAPRAQKTNNDALSGEASSVETPDLESSEGRVLWGRVAILGLGALSLLGSLVTLALVPFTAISWVLPLLLFLVTLASLGSLRFLAIRDRNRRRARLEAQLEAQKQKRQAKAPAREAVPAPALELKPAPVLTEAARRQLPVNHAVKSLRKARTSHQPGRNLAGQLSEAPAPVVAPAPVQAPALADRTWKPVEVPRPVYLEAQTSHRPLPEPVQAEQAPVAQSETLAQAASLNLDDVLKRRRA